MVSTPKILTDRFIQNAAPAEKIFDIADGQVPGLILRIHPSGTKSWLFRYTAPVTNKRRRQSVGSYPMISLAEARTRALKSKRQVADGVDPVTHADKVAEAAVASARAEAERATLGVAYLGYRQRRINMKRDKSLLDTDQRWRRTLKSHEDRKLEDCDRAWVKRMYRDAGGDEHKAEVVQVHRLIKAILSYAVDEEMIDRHHAPRQPPYKLEHREVVPSIEEMAQLWKACDNLPKAKARCIRTLMLTLKRRGETKDMRTAHIDTGKRVWLIPHTDTKKGTAEGVPLTDQMLLQLTGTGEYQFALPGTDAPMHPRTISKAFDTVRKKVKLDHLHMHDFRTAGATWLANHGTARADVSEVLGHTAIGVGGAHAAYDQSRFTPGKRMALEKWNTALLAVVEGRKLDEDGNPVQDGNVITLTR